MLVTVTDGAGAPPDRASGIARDALVALAIKIAGSLLWVAYSIVLARVLPQSDFGRLFYVVNVVLLAGPVCGVGFENSVLRHGSRYGSGEQGRFRALAFQSRAYGIGAAAVLAAAIFVAYLVGVQSPLTDDLSLLPYAALAAVFYTVMCVHRDLLRSAGRLIASQMGVNVTRALVPLILSLVLYAAGMLTLQTALAAYVAGLGVSLVLETCYFVGMRLPPADRSSNRQHLAVAARTWPGDIFNALLLRGDVLIVGALMPIDVVAVYIVAQRLAIFVDFPLDAIRTSAGPALSRAFAQDPRGRFRNAAGEISAIFGVGGIVGALGVAILGMPALALFGASYTQGYAMVLVLVLGRIAPVILGPASIVMNLTDQEATFSLVNGLSALLLCLLVAAGTTAGPLGPAFGVCISTWISAAVLAALVRRHHGFWIGLLNPDALAMLRPSAMLRTVASLRSMRGGQGGADA